MGKTCLICGRWLVYCSCPVTRHEPIVNGDSGVLPHPGGSYVTYDDYAALRAERDALKAENTRLRDALGWIAGHDVSGADAFIKGIVCSVLVAAARKALGESK